MPRIPFGLNNKNPISIIKEMQSFHVEFIHKIPMFSDVPIKIPPSSAPGMLPIPPIIEAMIPLSIIYSPIVGVIFVSKEIKRELLAVISKELAVISE